MWKYESQEEESGAFQSPWRSNVGLQWGENSRTRSTQQYTEGKEKAERSDSIMQELPNDCWNVGLCDELLEGVALSPWLSCFSLSLPSWPPEYRTLPERMVTLHKMSVSSRIFISSSSVCGNIQSEWKSLILIVNGSRQNANKTVYIQTLNATVPSLSVSGVQWSWRPLREWQPGRTASTPLSTGLCQNRFISEHFPYRKWTFSSQIAPEFEK